MGSLLHGLLDNATLTFQVGTGALTIDPATGNYMESSTPLSIRAYLKGSSARVERPNGVNLSAVYLEGNVTDPAILPEAIALDQIGIANIGGIEGRFFMVPYVQSAALQKFDLLKMTGTKIAGWFEIRGGESWHPTP